MIFQEDNRDLSQPLENTEGRQGLSVKLYGKNRSYNDITGISQLCTQ